MAKSIIIENLRDDTKDLGQLGDRRIYLGAACDRGIVGAAQPSVELPDADYRELLKNPARKAALQSWEASREVLVIGG